MDSGGDSASCGVLNGHQKPARNNLLCSYCRKDKKACVKNDKAARCERCVHHSRNCDEPHLAPVMRVAKPLIVRVTTLLLRHSRLCCKTLYDVVFRHPYAADKTYYASEYTSSISLNQYLSPMCRLLKTQVEALAASTEILNGVWSGSKEWYHKCAPRDYKSADDIELLLVAIEENLIQATTSAGLRDHLKPPSKEFQGTNEDMFKAYQTISESVRDILANIAPKIEFECAGSQIQFCRGFPPAHLAYIAGDTSVSLNFWECDPLATDMLNRRLEVLLTERDQLETLKLMNAHPTAGCLSINHKDGRGLTVIDVSAVLGLSACLPYYLELASSYATPPLDSNLFELALAACSKLNTDHLIRQGYARFDYVFYFRTAIQLRRLDLVEELKGNLIKYLSDKPSELNELIRYASLKAREVKQDYDQKLRLWNDHARRPDWLERLQELLSQERSIERLVDTLRYRQLEPSRGRIALESMCSSMLANGQASLYNQIP